MKHLKLIFACLLTAIFSIGQVWAVDPTIANTDNSGTCVWTDGTATITQVKWAGSTAVNNTYASNPRVYGGHVLLFDAGEGNSWKSFEYTVATTYYGKSVVWGSSASEITSSNYSSATAGTGSLVSTSGGSSTLSFTANRYAYVYNSATSSPVQLRISAFTATYETSGGGDVIVKTLKSIEVSGQTTIYDQFAPFSFNGTCTATYSVTKNDVPQEDEQKVVTPTSVSSPDMTTTGVKEVTVSYTEADVTKTANYNITVNEHTVTPGTYDIVPNNAFWGTSYTGTDAAAADVLSGSQDDISIVHTKSGSNLYVNDSQTRAYSGHTMAISVPSGYVITDVKFTTGTWEGTPNVSTGDMTDSKTWEGSANSVTFTFTAKSFINNIAVTYEEEDNTTVKTLKSIAVSEMTTTYEVGDVFSFDGTCTATYTVTQGGEAQPDENKTVTPTSVSSPDMSTTGEKTVTVSFTDNEVTKTAEYTITVNPHTVTPGAYTVLLNNVLWGVEAGQQAAGVTSMSGSSHDINFATTKGSSQMYASATQTRFYANATMTISAPSGYNITSIVFAEPSSDTKWDGSISVDKGTYTEDTKSWAGEESAVVFTFGAQNRIATATVTYAAVDPTAPAVSVASSIDDVSAAGVSDQVLDVTYTNINLASVAVALFNDAECESAFTDSWLSISLNSDKDIVYTLTENSGVARAVYIQLTAPASNGTSPDVVKVIQVSQSQGVPTFTSLADVFATATSTDQIVKIVFDDAVVTGKKGDNTAYLTDKNNTYGLVIFTSNHGFNVGDVLNGTVQTTLCKYQGNSELKGLTSTTEGLAVSAGSPISTPSVVGDPTTLTGANTGSVIKITGSCTKETKNENDYYYINGVQLYNALSEYTTPTVDDQYNCTGVFVMFNAIKEIMPRAASELEHIDVPTAVITFDNFSIEKGQNITLSATVSPAVAASAEVSYSIVDGDAYVSLEGAVLTANEIGTAHIRATVADNLPDYNGSTKDITVTVTAVDSRYKAEQTGFTAIAGTLTTVTEGTHKDKQYISYEAKQGTSSTVPSIYDTDKIRLYQNGGLLVIGAAKGCKIDQVFLTTGGTYNTTTIGYSQSELSIATSGDAVAKNTEWHTAAGLNSDSVVIVCLGTDKYTRIDVAKLDVRYTGDPASVSSIAVSGTYQAEFEKNEAFNHTGVIVTATYSDESTANVSALAEFSDPDMSTTGEKTITVSYGGKSTTYTIEVVSAIVTGISLSGTYPTQFAQGAEFSHTGMIVTATYSDASEVDVTGEATFSGYDMSGAGVQMVTVAFGGKDATYSIIVVPANTDIITATGIGLEGTGYKDWSNKTFNTDAKYAGNSYANNTEAIQIRTSGSEEGIVVTTQNGTKVVKSVVVSFQTAPSGTRKLQVYGKSTAYSSAADLFKVEDQGTLIGELAADGTVDCSAANYEFIGIRSNDGAMYLASVMVVWGDADVTPEPVYTVVRTGLVADRHYTVCLENNITAVKGATFWSLTYKNSTNTEVYLVEETAPFAAGKPYIFQATDDNEGKLEVIYGEVEATSAGTNGALVGTFSDLSASDLNSINVDPVKVYMLFNNELRPIGTNNHLDAHRAYVRYDQLVEGTPNPAPGRRVKAMPMQGEGTQGVENIEASEKPMKMMIDGQLFIIRGEKMYDATGRLVK